MSETTPLNQLQDIVSQAQSAGADAADAICVASTDLSFTHRLGKPEDIERAESLGLGLRVFVGHKYATISTEDMSDDTVAEAVERCVAMAKASTEDEHSRLAPEEMLVRDVSEKMKKLDLYDAVEPSPDTLQEACAKAEDAALAVAGITNSEGAEASFGQHHVSIASSNGLAQSYSVSEGGVSLSVLAGEGTAMERDYDYSAARHWEDLGDFAAIGKNAAELTLRRLNPRKVASCQVPIIFDPRVSKSLLGAFSSAINGSSVARGTSFLKEKMGEQLFHESITISDDPHRVRGLSSRPFDAEGLQNAKRFMVKEGCLQSWFLDLRSASQLGLKSTAHASRGLSGTPSPSSSNLYMEAGSVSVKDLIGDVKDGFYVTDTFGMGVNLITGDYSQGASGLWIENGELSYSVSEITIAGHLLDMFKHLTPADDLVFRYGTNAPTVRVDGMTIAGGV